MFLTRYSDEGGQPLRWPRLPFFRATREFREDLGLVPPQAWRLAHTDFDSDVEWYAHRTIWRAVAFAFWYLKYRWIIEVWMRYRIADIPSGTSCRYWYHYLRAPWKWTLKRERKRPAPDLKESFLAAAQSSISTDADKT